MPAHLLGRRAGNNQTNIVRLSRLKKMVAGGWNCTLKINSVMGRKMITELRTGEKAQELLLWSTSKISELWSGCFKHKSGHLVLFRLADIKHIMLSAICLWGFSSFKLIGQLCIGRTSEQDSSYLAGIFHGLKVNFSAKITFYFSHLYPPAIPPNIRTGYLCMSAD